MCAEPTSDPSQSHLMAPVQEALRQLEGIVHPLVTREKALFLADMARQGQPLVVLDIPLLYETGAEVRVLTAAAAAGNGGVNPASFWPCQADVQVKIAWPGPHRAL